MARLPRESAILSVPLNIRGLAAKLDQLGADQAALMAGQDRQEGTLNGLQDVVMQGFTQLTNSQVRQAEVLNSHTLLLERLVASQERLAESQERLARGQDDLVQGQARQTTLLEQLLAQGGNPPAPAS
jgi:hypothetical protein